MLKLLRPFEARRADWSIAVTVFLLSALGMVMIWSASSYTAQRDTGDSLFFVKKQFLGFVAGESAFACFCFLDLDRLKKWALPLFGGGLGKSRQEFELLPVAESDCVLWVIGEGRGLLGPSAERQQQRREGHKGQQRHVVGDEHGAEEGQ